MAFRAIVQTHIWTTSQTITANQGLGTSEIEQSNSKKFPSGVSVTLRALDQLQMSPVLGKVPVSR